MSIVDLYIEMEQDKEKPKIYAESEYNENYTSEVYEGVSASYQIDALMAQYDIDKKYNLYGESVGALFGGFLAFGKKIILLVLKMLLGIKGIILGVIIAAAVYIMKRRDSGNKTSYSGGGGGGGGSSSKKESSNTEKKITPEEAEENLIKEIQESTNDVAYVEPLKLGVSGETIKAKVKPIKRERKRQKNKFKNTTTTTEVAQTPSVRDRISKAIESEEIFKMMQEAVTDDDVVKIMEIIETSPTLVDYALKEYRYDTDANHNICLVRTDIAKEVVERMRDEFKNEKRIGNRSVAEFNKGFYKFNSNIPGGLICFDRKDGRQSGSFDEEHMNDMIKNIGVWLSAGSVLQCHALTNMLIVSNPDDVKVTERQMSEVIDKLPSDLWSTVKASIDTIHKYLGTEESVTKIFELFSNMFKRTIVRPNLDDAPTMWRSIDAMSTYGIKDFQSKIQDAGIDINYFSIFSRPYPKDSKYSEVIFSLGDASDRLVTINKIRQSIKFTQNDIDSIKSYINSVIESNKSSSKVLSSINDRKEEDDKDYKKFNDALNLAKISMQRSTTFSRISLEALNGYTKLLSVIKHPIYQAIYERIGEIVVEITQDAAIEIFKVKE